MSATQRILLASIGAVGCLQLACSDPQNCDRSLVTGERLQLDVGSVISERPPCDPALGITPERRLDASVTSFEGGRGCVSAVVMVDNLEGWELTPRDQEADGGHLLEGHYLATRGECSGALHLDVTPVSVPTPPLDAENAAELHVYYLASRDVSGCPLSCDATYRVQVTRP